jgi:predicted lipid-binding transport protein (Tim44 family)
MLVGLLLCGIVVGGLAAATSLIAGFSLWAAFGFYILGGIVGLSASSLALLIHHRRRTPDLPAISPAAAAEREPYSTRG